LKLYLLFPLFSSITFVLAMLFFKRATIYNVGVWRTTFVSNFISGMCFLVLLPFGEGAIDPLRLWQPLVTGALFVGGQALTMLALEKGDVSVATPTLGVKTIIVAWLSVLLLAVEIPWQLWMSAAMTFLAVGLLSVRPSSKGGSSGQSKEVLRTIAIAFLSAVSYSIFDVLVQKWGATWSVGYFLPLTFAFCALLSFGFIPLFSRGLRTIPRTAWRWLLGGSAFMTAQALSLVTALAVFGDATSMNVVYSSRGLWSVVAVWLIGHWFANTESKMGLRVMLFRLAGALLMTFAIIVTFVT